MGITQEAGFHPELEKYRNGLAGIQLVTVFETNLRTSEKCVAVCYQSGTFVLLLFGDTYEQPHIIHNLR